MHRAPRRAIFPRVRDPGRTVALLTAAIVMSACARQRPANNAETAPMQAEAARASPSRESPDRANEDRTASEADPEPVPEGEYEKRYSAANAQRTQVGRAAYYANSLAGNRTANGERYDPRKFTAAHRSFPFDTIVRVVRRDNGKQTYVRITDRGPFGDSKRVIDLSGIAAERLDMVRAGVIDVRLEVVEWGQGRRR